MDALPPPGSMKRRAAVAIVLVIAALWAYVVLHALLAWVTRGEVFPVRLLLASVSGILVGRMMLQESLKQLKREI